MKTNNDYDVVKECNNSRAKGLVSHSLIVFCMLLLVGCVWSKKPKHLNS